MPKAHVQTVGNPDIKGVPNTLWPAVARAVSPASRFIYIEDQYFWSLHLVKELIAAAKRVQHDGRRPHSYQIEAWDHMAVHLAESETTKSFRYMFTAPAPGTLALDHRGSLERRPACADSVQRRA